MGKLIQNVLNSHYFISDLGEGGQSLKPFEILDLDSLEPKDVAKSRDLKKSLLAGHLVEVSEEEAEALLIAEQEKIRRETLNSKNMQGKKLYQQEVGGREMLVDVVNLGHFSSADTNNSAIVDSQSKNDSNKYAIAYSRARKEYAERGKLLSAPAFNEMVGHQSKSGVDLISYYVSQEAKQYSNGLEKNSSSGEPGRSYYATDNDVFVAPRFDPFSDLDSEIPDRVNLDDVHKIDLDIGDYESREVLDLSIED